MLCCVQIRYVYYVILCNIVICNSRLHICKVVFICGLVYCVVFSYVVLHY
jgi:hypothetical protein